jgi:hypothetical protein
MTMTNEVFLALLRTWVSDLRGIAARKPDVGACTLANAMELWLWTLQHLQSAKDSLGAKLLSGNRHGVVFPLADALCWLLASRQQILDVLELEQKGTENAVVAEGLAGLVNFFSDLCATQSASAAGESARICAELVYGYNAVDTCSADGCCCQGATAAALEPFARLRQQVDACLAGSRLAKDRAADALVQVMIPEALDYPR